MVMNPMVDEKPQASPKATTHPRFKGLIGSHSKTIDGQLRQWPMAINENKPSDYHLYQFFCGGG